MGSFTHAEIIILDKNIDKEIFIPKDETIKSLIKKNETFWYGAYIDDNKVGWFKISFGNKEHLKYLFMKLKKKCFINFHYQAMMEIKCCLKILLNRLIRLKQRINLI